MRPSGFVVCLISLSLFIGCSVAQTGAPNITITGWAYFNNIQGSSAATEVCRPAAEIQYGGPTQNPCTYYGFPVPPGAQGRWGVAASSSGVSGLGFEPIQNTVVQIDSVFYIGELIHFNFPIYYPCLTLDMNLILQIEDQDGNMIGTYTFTFLMKVNETVNEDTTGPCPFPTTIPCSDKITFDPNSLSTTTSFTVNEVDYTITLEGFKESTDSTSSAITYFISNEEQDSIAYLFATISVACPKTCVNGGSYIYDSNNDCSCDCAGSTCPYTGETHSANCSCLCPNPSLCNNGNGGTLTKECTCECNACTLPQTSSGSDCGCACPSNYCGTGTISNPNTCACDCPTAACSVQNEVRNSQCACVCDLTCKSPYILDSTASLCDCVCPSTTCASGYTLNPTTCECECTLSCPNSEVTDQCTCGPCEGNWVQGANGQCTSCGLPLSSCDSQGEKLDNSTCQCVCSSLVCNLYTNGQIVNPNAFCACMNCTAGTCYCGNGIVEAGEQCDTGNVSNPCCVSCQFTRNPCNDSNMCTDTDVCNGAGTCAGNYDCVPSTTCNTVTCNPAVGCISTPVPEGTGCGPSTPYDYCQYRCVAGVCQNQSVICEPPANMSTCYTPECVVATGLCETVPLKSGSCYDGDLCSVNDQCSNGVCSGVPKVCPPVQNQCQTVACQAGTCVPINVQDGTGCNADNNSCTVGDACSKGRCLPGAQTICNNTNQCTETSCAPTTGFCIAENLNSNYTCNDNNSCTTDDHCNNGQCTGTTNSTCLVQALAPHHVATTTATVFAVAGAAAAVGAIAGVALLVKKARSSKLMDPASWNPDMFHSVGSNPLYKGSDHVVDNRLYGN